MRPPPAAMSLAQAGRAYILVAMEAGMISSRPQSVSELGAREPRTQTRPEAATTCSGTNGPRKCSAVSFGATFSTLLDAGVAATAVGATP